MVNVWGIHGGRTGDADSLFLQQNFIALGWNRIGDLKKLPPNRNAFKTAVKANYPENKSGAVPVQAGQLYRFAYELKVGDLVCYFSRRDRLIHIGRVTDEYAYNQRLEPSYPHLRAVEWLQSYSRTHFTQTAIFELSSSMSFFSIKTHAAEFTAAAQGKAKTLPVAKPPNTMLEVKPTKQNHNAKLFISYRRKSWPFAHRLVDDIQERILADIFVDLSGIDETDFEQSILKHLSASDVVLVVLSELTFAPDRIHQEDDWVRREIAVALEQSKQIVLVNIDNAYLPSAADLPENIREIVAMQSIPFYAEYWPAAVDRLVQFLSTITLAPLVKADTSTSTPSTPAQTNVTLKDAMAAFEDGEYEKSIFLLNALREAGFKSKLVSVEEILERAMLLRDIEERRHEALEEYENIAALATSKTMFGQAQAAWAKFQQQYPDFEDDFEQLSRRLGSTSTERAVHLVEPVEEATQILASRHIKRREFWAGLLNQSKTKTDLGRGRATSIENWLSLGSGRSGFSYNYLILMQEGGVGLYIDIGDQSKNKTIFDHFYENKIQIEAEFGSKLDWRRMDDKISCRIVKLYQGIGGLSEPDSWPALQATMINAMIRLDAAFRSRIAALQI